jgi:hypothetical protein
MSLVRRSVLSKPSNWMWFEPCVADGFARRALERFDHADQLRGTKHALVLRESRREIDDTKRAAVVSKRGFENVSVLDVALRAAPVACGADREAAAFALVEQSRKYRLRVEPRQATPDDLAVVGDERGELAVSDKTDVFEPHA